MKHSQGWRDSAHRWSPQVVQEIAKAPDMHAAATALVDAGIPVFPCAPDGKQPLTTHGFHDANTDPGVIGSWWRKWPNANIGIPTGATSGIDVVDVDVHPTGTGFPAFEQARLAGYVEGWAWLIRTPSAGIHAYYLRASNREQRSWQSPGNHIDFRGDGGYIVAPPSLVGTSEGTARSYELIAVAHHTPTSVDAAGLRSFLNPPRPIRVPKGMPAVGTRPDKLAAWVAARPEGLRNGGLFWAACRLAEDGHDLTSATSVLGNAACTAGLPEHEALSTIQSAYRTATRLGPEAAPSRPTRTVEAVTL